jgi:hypothetical protein
VLEFLRRLDNPAAATPAGGVVVQAVAPIGLHDRERGTLGFTTSLSFSKKLQRLALDPRVAMAFHAREHRRSSSTRYVLAQGTARVIEQPSDQQRALVRANAASFLGKPKHGPMWDYWMREYYVTRVQVEVAVTRICAWPTLDAAGAPDLVSGGTPARDCAYAARLRGIRWRTGGCAGRARPSTPRTPRRGTGRPPTRRGRC